MINDREELRCFAECLREQLQGKFRPDTAAQGYLGDVPSAGHCAAVAVIVRQLIGGEFVSATVDGVSHWFNRITGGCCAWDVDLTADQFGDVPVALEESGGLYEGTRVRSSDEVNLETWNRAKLLAHRAGLTEAEGLIESTLNRRRSLIG